MKATILTIGSEVLAGDIVNKNAQYYSLALNDLGFEVDEHITIDDDFDRLASFVKENRKEGRLLLTTGGLGPTEDDLTKEAIGVGLGRDMLLNEESLARLEKYFSDKDFAMEENINQAYFPKGSQVLENKHGTADGFFLDDHGFYVVVLPGPPRENVPMFETYARPYLEKLSENKHEARYYQIFGIGEWETEARIQDLVHGSDKVATFARDEGLFIKVSLDISKYKNVEERFKTYEDLIRKEFPENYIGEGIVSPENLLGAYLIKNSLKVSTGESITGGLIASKLVSVPGISACLKESYICYANEVKERVLGVDPRTIEKYGVVSKETVEEMAYGLKRISGSDLCITSSGYAGPGESAGLVYYGVLYKGNFIYKENHFRGDRNDIRERTSREALLSAYSLVKKLDGPN